MPFAGYKNFAACVAANADKGDPEAYCATIMRAVEKHAAGKHDQKTHGNWAKGTTVHRTEPDPLSDRKNTGTIHAIAFGEEGQAGELRYRRTRDEIQITDIVVRSRFRRQGAARAMYEKLKERWPYHKIVPATSFTREGAAFWEAMTGERVHGNPFVTPPKIMEKVNPDHPLVKHYPGGQDHDQSKHGNRGYGHAYNDPDTGFIRETDPTLQGTPHPEGGLVLPNGIRIAHYNGPQRDSKMFPRQAVWSDPTERDRAVIAEVERLAPGLLDAAAVRDDLTADWDLEIEFVDGYAMPMNPSAAAYFQRHHNLIRVSGQGADPVGYTQFAVEREPTEMAETLIHELGHKIDARLNDMESSTNRIGWDQFTAKIEPLGGFNSIYDGYTKLSEAFGPELVEAWGYPLMGTDGPESFSEELFAEGVRYYYTDRPQIKAFDGAFGTDLDAYVEDALDRAGAFAIADQGRLFKADDHTPEEFFALMDWVKLAFDLDLPGEGMTPQEAYKIADRLWERTEGGGGDFELEKHMGPGDHPSGSPQSVHGRSGTGTLESPDVEFKLPEGMGTWEEATSPTPPPPEEEPDLTPLHELRTLIAETDPARLRVTKEQFASGDLYQEVFRGRAYMTAVGPQSYNHNTYLYVKEPTDDTVGFCGICGQGVIQKTGPEFRAELADDAETYRQRADAYKNGWTGIDDNTARREYDRWLSRSEEAANALARFDERGYAWAHFQPGRQNVEGSLVTKQNPTGDAGNALTWTAGERLGDKLIGTEEHGGKFHPYNPVSGHEKYITDDIVTAPVLDELEKRRDIHVAYDQAFRDSQNKRERLRVEGDRLGKAAMVEVKKVGRKVANEIDRRAAGGEPSYKVGDKVHVPDFSESQVEITAGPDENGRYDILTTSGLTFNVLPTEFVVEDSETKKLFEEKARQSEIARAANDKVAKLYARHRSLRETGNRNKYYAVPDADIKRWGKRKGYREYLALNESWADYGEIQEVEVPLVTRVSEYTNRDFTHVDTDSPEFIAVRDEWKSKGFTLISHSQYLDSMANEVNGTWGAGSVRNRAQNKIKKIRQQIDGLQFTSKGGDFTQSVIEVLSEYRDMGGEYNLVSRSAGAQMVTDVQDWLPADWIDASNDLGKLSAVKSNARGEYSPHNQRIRTDDHDTVLHELGHRTEHAIAEVRLLERAYYDSRTNDASDAQVKLSTLFPGHGYRSGEVSRPDEFTHAYMGKTYNGRGSVEEAYELLSMGLSNVFFETSVTKRGAERPTGRNNKPLAGFKDHPKAMSPDFREFILGLLAVAGSK